LAAAACLTIAIGVHLLRARTAWNGDFRLGF
jgi:hypothetical protein